MPKNLKEAKEIELNTARFGSELSELLGAPLRGIAEKKYKETMANREKYVQAFIAETGLKPSECELVEERGIDTITFYVRKRT